MMRAVPRSELLSPIRRGVVLASLHLDLQRDMFSQRLLKGRDVMLQVGGPGAPLSQLSDLLFETRIAAESVADFLAGGRLRLGVTGLSRAGKTVFITALVHHLTRAMAARPA